jgi:methylated-DNA-[protein]-cysteine S-methyltransferase
VKLWLSRIRSPIGEILLVSDGDALRALDFGDCEARMHRLLRRYCGPHTLVEAKGPNGFSKPLRAYFEGDLAALAEIPVRADGTAFQRLVWAALRNIPPGETLTYGQMAARIGRPTAMRAVGHASGANPIALVVPCHRLVGADRRLTGYAGGLARKEWLLGHEARDS